uniref:Uncharacterized protein n=1 Tax=Ascaris lumbricoides TaxID=6252 RepID=A0A0M3IL97_ASCLU
MRAPLVVAFVTVRNGLSPSHCVFRSHERLIFSEI